MPIESADFFSSVELYTYKTGKFWKYQKYHLKLKIEGKLAGKIFGEKSDQSQCKFYLQGTLSSYFLIVGTQPSALSSETTPI